MKRKYILSLDQGTTSSRALIYDHDGAVIAGAQREFPQFYPRPGWVEHDPHDIWNSQIAMANQALQRAECAPSDVAAIGITNQRETTLVWERESGQPICNAIVWQDRRTADTCEALVRAGLEATIRRKTGLVIDAYFSGTKLKWILDTVVGARARATRGELLFGTVDSWLIWNLTGGRQHVTDHTNASRTMLYNIRDLCWDKELLQVLDIPAAMLPEVRSSSEVYGTTHAGLFEGAGIPIAGIAGDQQAALFGQACFAHGDAKNTYGTGSFILLNTGPHMVTSQTGLLTTIAWNISGETTYALEGAIFVTGGAIQWLRDELRIIHDAADTEYYAGRVEDSGGVYVVPAFAGLGAPYWDMYARGAIVGLTRGTNRNHIVRATLEALAYQTRDVLECMQTDAGIATSELKVDGGAAANNFLMQFQSDILGVRVARPRSIEATSRGSAYLAGLGSGFWENRDAIARSMAIDRRFTPSIDENRRGQLYEGWKRAVSKAQHWEQP